MRAWCLLAVAALLASLPAAAQVEVMEPGATASPYPQPAYAQPVQARPASRATAPAAGGESGLGELYNQVLQLRDEVQQLRGLVEEQGEELRQLKQQRLDDYIGLDRRITALGGAPGSAPAQGTPPADASTGSAPPDGVIRADVPPQAPVQVPAAPLAGEEPAYQAAYELVRARKFPEALAAFNDFLDRYPQGALAGNAHFWIGELYLLNGDSESARPHYEALVYQFPGNAKMPDGMFKLGRIYHQQGDAVRAKELLQRVVSEYGNSGSSAARLAREYLQQNFGTQ
jgi:tol-pal system protein YbgF